MIDFFTGTAVEAAAADVLLRRRSDRAGFVACYLDVVVCALFCLFVSGANARAACLPLSHPTPTEKTTTIAHKQKDHAPNDADAHVALDVLCRVQGQESRA